MTGQVRMLYVPLALLVGAAAPAHGQAPPQACGTDYDSFGTFVVQHGLRTGIDSTRLVIRVVDGLQRSRPIRHASVYAGEPPRRGFYVADSNGTAVIWVEPGRPVDIDVRADSFAASMHPVTGRAGYADTVIARLRVRCPISAASAANAPIPVRMFRAESLAIANHDWQALAGSIYPPDVEQLKSNFLRTWVSAHRSDNAASGASSFPIQVDASVDSAALGSLWMAQVTELPGAPTLGEVVQHPAQWLAALVLARVGEGCDLLFERGSPLGMINATDSTATVVYTEFFPPDPERILARRWRGQWYISHQRLRSAVFYLARAEMHRCVQPSGAGPSRMANVRLGRPPAVVGRVIERQSGRPIPHLILMRDSFPLGMTDSNGLYEISFDSGIGEHHMVRIDWRPFRPASKPFLMRQGFTDTVNFALDFADPPCCSLVGEWSFQIHLDSAGRMPPPPRSRDIAGTIVFADSVAPAGSKPPGSPYFASAYGRFAIDVSPFFGGPVAPDVSTTRFGPVDSTFYREAEGSVFSGDSVSISLIPRISHGAISFAGRIRGDSITGVWHQRAYCCGAYGTFTATRRAH